MEHHYLVAVHAGAGFHSSKHESKYRAGITRSCHAAAQALQAGSSALDAVAAAIAVLEDCEVCNAGRGSNLTYNGRVECDASVMAGDGTFGAVAAVPGVGNPISVAHQLALEQNQPLSYGRVRPMLLAGDQARAWALLRGIPAAQTAQEAAEWNVTEAAKRRWSKYRRMVDGSVTSNSGDQHDSAGAAAEGSAAQPGTTARGAAPMPCAAAGAGTSDAHQAKRARYHHRHPQQEAQQEQPQEGAGEGGSLCEGIQPRDEDEDDSWAHDTVGCVVVDGQGRVAAGVSSGGIALKTEGRVGEAAVFGAGCWAQGQGQEKGRPAVACSVTGVGERVMQHLVARCCADRVAAAPNSAAQQGTGGGPSEACSAVLRETVLQGPPPRDCGVLCVRAEATPESRQHEQPPPAAQQEAVGVGGQGQGDAPATVPSAPMNGQEAALAASGRVVEVELGLAHCSHSMAAGYLSHAMSRPHVTFLWRDAAPEGRREQLPRQPQRGEGGRRREGGTAEVLGDVKTLTYGLHWRL